MCEVAPSLAGAVAEQCDKAAKAFVAECVVKAYNYATWYNLAEVNLRNSAYMRGAQMAAQALANTPEMALAMQRAFETHALTGE